MPIIAQQAPVNFPKNVRGTTSPYPTVAIVIIDHFYREVDKKVLKSSFFNPDIHLHYQFPKCLLVSILFYEFLTRSRHCLNRAQYNSMKQLNFEI